MKEVHISTCPERWFEVKTELGIKCIYVSRSLDSGFWAWSFKRQELTKPQTPASFSLPSLPHRTLSPQPLRERRRRLGAVVGSHLLSIHAPVHAFEF